MMTDAQVADQLADWLHGSLGTVDPSPELLGRVTSDVAATTQARSRWPWRGLGGGRRGWSSGSARALRVDLLVAVGACVVLGAAVVLAPRPTARLAVGAGPSYPPLPSLPARGPLTSQVPGGPVHGTPPTVGRVSDDPDAPMPDFIPVAYRDRDGIAGYVASRDMYQVGTFPWWYQQPPIPVYAEDLWTLIGFMFPGKGFVPLGVDPNTVAGP